MNKRPVTAWTRPLAILTLTLLVTACAPAPRSAICAGTERERDALNVALLADGGPRSLVAGADLLAVLDAGCAQ
jgi:hypothetical protein